MKLFSSERYTKPGKGVDKNEKPKPAFIRFFITLWNKRFKLIAVNFFYAISNLLTIALVIGAVYGCVYVYNIFAPDSKILYNIANDENVMSIFMRFLLFFAVLFTSLPIFANGPTYAGLTYIIKSFATETPVFTWHDFITKTKTNANLGVKTMLVNGILGFLIMLNGTAYMVISDPNNPNYNTIPFMILFIEAAVTIFLAVLLVLVNMFTYPMMVTFRVSFKQLYKNSFVLVMVKWLPTLLIALLDVALIGVPILLIPMYNYMLPVLVLVAYLAITPGLISLINMFYVYPILKKYLIDNTEADKSHKDDTPKDSAATEIPSRGGRFENGMWIND